MIPLQETIMENIELPDEEVPVDIDLSVEANEPEIEAETEPVEPETVQQSKDDGKQDEAEEYGKKVNKRINKLVAERNIERDENTKLRERLDKLEKSQYEATQERVNSDIDSRVADIKRRKMAYMDDGEHEKAEELNDEMLDLKIKRNQQSQPKPEVQPEQQYQQSEQYQQPQAEAEWNKNNEWFTSNSNSHRANYAKALYADLLQEGYDPNNADLYSELDERLGNKPPLQREKPPLQAVPDRGTVTGSSKQVKFTQRDTQIMRDYGLDPNNTDHRKAWLENKKA